MNRNERKLSEWRKYGTQLVEFPTASVSPSNGCHVKGRRSKGSFISVTGKIEKCIPYKNEIHVRGVFNLGCDRCVTKSQSCHVADGMEVGGGGGDEIIITEGGDL